MPDALSVRPMTRSNPACSSSPVRPKPALSEEQPGIEIELVSSNRTENLLQREADIAVRMYRPTQTDVFTKKIAEMPIGLFASERYLQQHGYPDTIASLAGHRILGSDRFDMIQKGFKEAEAGV
ncbi:MAG: LysR substrate-binding domain-containing protein, partial [Alphaproteobacteria bacterium]